MGQESKRTGLEIGQEWCQLESELAVIGLGGLRYSPAIFFLQEMMKRSFWY